MTRIYRYIQTHDSGIAPCPDGGQITLATCKPVIRRVARPGDWVLGFRPGSLERGLVLWAGRVQSKLSHGDYQRLHARRSDAVYRQGQDGRYQRLDPDYHPTQSEMDRDVREPVLLFDKSTSVYLCGRPELLPDHLVHLAGAGRGHRVSNGTVADVTALEIWVANLTDGELPKPTSGRRSCQ